MLAEWIPACAGMTGVGRFSNDQQVTLLLNPLSSGSADCQWSEGSPALRYSRLSVTTGHL